MKKSLGARTLVYPTPVFLVGTYDKNGTPNVMTVAWAGICCSQPPCVAVSLRKATHTYTNIMERRAFTLSIPSQKQVRQADYFGLSSGHDVDKFASSGMTAVRSTLVDAPCVGECPMTLECKLAHSYELGLHTQFVAYIMDVKVEEEALNSDNTVDIKKVNPLIFAPDSQSYYGVGDFVAKAFSVGKK
jgi:flavin reductase (DIM6/NTAB) family NADH-FMN oxidoreductase RutF